MLQDRSYNAHNASHHNFSSRNGTCGQFVVHSRQTLSKLTQMSRQSGRNLNGRERASIVKTGYIMSGQLHSKQPWLTPLQCEERINMAELARRCNVTRPNAYLQWGRRKEFEETGQLEPRPRSAAQDVL